MIAYNEIKDLDEKALKAKLNETRKELFSLKMQKETSGIEKPHLIKDAKKDIAKLLTAINAK